MSDPQVTPDELRSQQSQETVHERITPVPFAVDPLAEEAAGDLGRRYREAATTVRLRPRVLADAVNGIEAAHPPAIIRLLCRQPGLVLHALGQAKSAGTLDTDGPARSVLDFVGGTALRDFVDAVADVATRPEVLTPLAEELGLEPGDVPRDALVERLRSDGVDIREGRFTESLKDALRAVRDERAGDPGPREGPPKAPAGAPGPAGREEERVPDRGEQAARGRGRGLGPPDLWGVDCDLDLPVERVAPPAQGDLLEVARTIATLYQFTERQPLFPAMDRLRSQALDGDLIPLDVAVARKGVEGESGRDEQLCRLRLSSYSWNHEFDPLTLRRRADVAATIGIRDSAATARVNSGFALAADQLVDVLTGLVTDREKYPADWVRTVAADVSLQLAGSFRTAVTGGVLVDVALWRRQFRLASEVFTRPLLRELLGVTNDPDRGPAPAIRKVLPSTRFDAAALYREWVALDRVLDLARRLAIDKDVPQDELESSAAAALTLRALRGRLRLPALPGAPG
ncbi:hypothetical protein [Modestobacter excelsi]|uniref:hypothetical protein n=1 Tax=Modestobacter excelsi TaxID=2213161 RepID=UPI00110CA9E7|nr:hypothetical protein [Modestobacter excelsi]